MRLTKQTNYALRMMMYCATNEDRLSRIGDIATIYSVSELFLFKILRQLVDAKLITTVRGRSGGIKLARSADSITLYDAISVTEEGFDMAECFKEETTLCPLIKNCGLSSALHEALAAFFSVLKGYTLADIVSRGTDMFNLLGLDDLEKENTPDEPALK